ncbi:GNAT family N-acetyltransferase [Microlunatus sp. GCM10028923]|uniref:GNAT family N-acetyltransferase n=1 Tax=Microlunatus sp. GCM10028923 TaxID=3273400 RepID=UPI003611FAB9
MTDPPPHLTGADVGVLTTERLRLRLLTPDDLDAVHGYLSRPDVCRYLLHEPRTREQVAERLAEVAGRNALRDTGDTVRLAVVRTENELVLGQIVIVVEQAGQSCVELGWIFHPDHGGRGYATEAARAALAYAFETLTAHRVTASLHPDNEPSARLCRRLGMRQEAHHVDNWWIPDRGQWEDTAVFAILRRDWSGLGQSE